MVSVSYENSPPVSPKTPYVPAYVAEQQELDFILDHNIPFLEFEIDTENLVEDAIEVVLRLNPEFVREELVVKQLCDGITNKLILVKRQQLALLVRTYGHNTSILIDRRRELLNMLKLAKNGLSSQLIARFKNGIVYGYIDGEVFSVQDMSHPLKSVLVAEQMAIWHKLPCEPSPQLFITLERWLSVCILFLISAKTILECSKA
jgi:ethanolamine kinase